MSGITCMYLFFKVNSEEESVNSDVTDNTDRVNSNREIVEGNRHDFNVNASMVISTEFVSTERAMSVDNIQSNLTKAVAAAVMKEDEDSVVSSSEPRVTKNDAVMKEDEDSREELDS